MIRTRTVSALSAVALIAGLSSFSTLAQDSKKATEKSSTTEKPASTTPVVKKKSDQSRKVPDNFGKIGLSNEQRESIYKVRQSHQEKIASLKKQIDDIQAKEMAECEALLTDTQKKLLENLRAGSSRGAAKTVDATPKSTETAKAKN